MKPRLLVANSKPRVGQALAITAVLIVVGILVVWRIYASAGPLALEVETGTIAAPAKVIADTGASGGSAIKFGAPAPTPAPTPATGPSGEAMPVGDLPGWKQTVAQDFTTPAASGTTAGSFKSVYASTWCGYNEAQGGYYNNEVLSAHDGVMDFSLDGTKGAAGSFGSGGTCGQLYGRFSIRFKAVDAVGYGAVTMVWPNGDTWGNGEVDYPEGDLDNTFNVNQHGVGCTNCGANIAQYKTGVTYRDWHTATTEWTASGVSYYLDGKLLTTVTNQVPINNHRMTIQMKPTHTPAYAGHYLVDWVSIYTVK